MFNAHDGTVNPTQMTTEQKEPESLVVSALSRRNVESCNMSNSDKSKVTTGNEFKVGFREEYGDCFRKCTHPDNYKPPVIFGEESALRKCA